MRSSGLATPYGVVLGAFILALGPGSATAQVAPGAAIESDLALATEDDNLVHATYFPAGVPNPPAAILVHDFGSDRSSWSSFARELNGRGIAVLTLDLRGHGGSKGSWSSPDAMPEKERERFPEDIRAGIRFIREREDVDGVRVVLLGAGQGANAAARYSVDDHLLLGLCLLSPTLGDEGERVDDALHGYGERPTLLVAAKADAGSAQSLPLLQEKARGTVEVVRADGSANGTGLLDSFRVRGAILEWLDGVYQGP